jgi:hypothetical protein
VVFVASGLKHERIVGLPEHPFPAPRAAITRFPTPWAPPISANRQIIPHD